MIAWHGLVSFQFNPCYHDLCQFFYLQLIFFQVRRFATTLVQMVATRFWGAWWPKSGKRESFAHFFNWQDRQLDPRVWHAALCQPGRVAHPQRFTTGSLTYLDFSKSFVSGSPADFFDSYPRVCQASWELDATCCWEYNGVDSNGKIEFCRSILFKSQTVDHAEPSCQWVSKNLSTKWHNLANFAARFGEDWFCQNSGMFSSAKKNERYLEFASNFCV